MAIQEVTEVWLKRLISKISSAKAKKKEKYKIKPYKRADYENMRMNSLEDGRKQLAVYQRKSNNYIKTCLNMKSLN